jgi:AcrR family transcriptional regulator
MAPKKVRKISSSYHHGDLRAAILQSAERILRREGLLKLSVRACARETGVSHTAPIHHFPNLGALLTALAATGFERLAERLETAMKKKNWKPADTSWAYILFAQDNRELFYLMNDPGRLDSTNATLRAARRKAYEALGRSNSISLEAPSLEQVGLLTGKWALSHGLALLMLGGRLGALLRMAPQGTTEEELVQATLKKMTGEMVDAHQLSVSR